MILKYRVTAADEGLSAGMVLKKEFDISQQLNKKIRYQGSLTLSGRPARMIDPCRQGDLIVAEYTAPDEMPAGFRTEPGHDILILYEDDQLIVADKPAPLLTHPAYKGQEDSLITLLGGRYTLHPVSRLDRQTSGLVILAKNGFIHHCLARTDIDKTYYGFVYGRPRLDDGSFTWPIRRQENSIIVRRITDSQDPAGQAARTDYKVCRSYGIGTDQAAVSKLLFQLKSGRTHQIRVHCQAAGCPLVGDGLYGFGDRISHKTPQPAFQEQLRRGASIVKKSADEGLKPSLAGISPAVIDFCESLLKRQALHAGRLAFAHPLTGEQLTFQSPLRPDLEALEERLVKGP